GIAVIKRDSGDQLLVADNLSDDVLLMDAATGNIIHRFDVSTGNYVPSAYPYAVAVDANPPGSAWVSLWNTSRIAKLDLSQGTIDSWIELAPPDRPKNVASHPTAMTVVHGVLFVTLSNSDKIAVVDTVHKKLLRYLSTQL